MTTPPVSPVRAPRLRTGKFAAASPGVMSCCPLMNPMSMMSNTNFVPGRSANTASSLTGSVRPPPVNVPMMSSQHAVELELLVG
jgi:hypothetical protein